MEKLHHHQRKLATMMAEKVARRLSQDGEAEHPRSKANEYPAVDDHEGEILDSYITRTRDKEAALRFVKKALKRRGSPEATTTNGLRPYSIIRARSPTQHTCSSALLRSSHVIIVRQAACNSQAVNVRHQEARSPPSISSSAASVAYGLAGSDDTPCVPESIADAQDRHGRESAECEKSARIWADQMEAANGSADRHHDDRNPRPSLLFSAAYCLLAVEDMAPGADDRNWG